MLQALVCIESVATMGLFVCHCWAYTLRYEHDTTRLLHTRCLLTEKRKPFVSKRCVRFQISFSPISLLTVCLGRCGPQCILVSLFFKNTTPGQSPSMSSRNGWITMEIRNSLPFNTHFIQYPGPFQTPLFCLFSMLHHVCYGLYQISVTQTCSY